MECQERATGVRRLVLPGNNLRGRLPGAVGGLRHLQVLDLARNALKGPMPADIAHRAQLRALDVQGNLLHGALPAALGDLRELRLFDVSANRLESPLPPLVQAHQLALFNASENAGLAGELPRWLLQAGALEALSMSGAGVCGELPAGLAALPRLRLFDLSRNELEGYIPPALLALASLQVVDLSRNRLEGNLRDVFPGPRENQSPRGAGSTTERGDGSGEGEGGVGGAGAGLGGANGSYPAEKPPGGELVVCALASNRLSGSLPASLPPGLMMLYVADNRLTGYHPDAVLQLGQLRYSTSRGTLWRGRSQEAPMASPASGAFRASTLRATGSPAVFPRTWGCFPTCRFYVSRRMSSPARCTTGSRGSCASRSSPWATTRSRAPCPPTCTASRACACSTSRTSRSRGRRPTSSLAGASWRAWTSPATRCPGAPDNGPPPAVSARARTSHASDPLHIS